MWSFTGDFIKILQDFTLRDHFEAQNIDCLKTFPKMSRIFDRFSKKIRSNKTTQTPNFRKFFLRNAIKRGELQFKLSQFQEIENDR